jgi:hypothetical protein
MKLGRSNRSSYHTLMTESMETDSYERAIVGSSQQPDSLTKLMDQQF